MDSIAGMPNQLNLISRPELRLPPRGTLKFANIEMIFTSFVDSDFLFDGVVGADEAAPKSFRFYINKTPCALMSPKPCVRRKATKKKTACLSTNSLTTFSGASFKMYRVEIFTDGACSGNPGPGGWGAILRHKDTEKELSGGERETTNNRMELTAVIEALKALKKECDITLYTDSRYVMDGVTKWLPNWKRTTGAPAIRNRKSKTSTSGKRWTACSAATKSSGFGSKATPATRKTNASIPSPAPSLNLSSLNLPQTPTMHTPLLPKKNVIFRGAQQHPDIQIKTNHPHYSVTGIMGINDY